MSACLLIGNGLNRCYEGISWETLLKKIANTYVENNLENRDKNDCLKILRIDVKSCSIDGSKIAWKDGYCRIANDIVKDLETV